jgi:hypothetical protein
MKIMELREQLGHEAIKERKITNKAPYAFKIFTGKIRLDPS